MQGVIELSVQNANVDAQAAVVQIDERYQLFRCWDHTCHTKHFSILQGLFTVLTIQYLNLNNSFDSVNETLSSSYGRCTGI